MSLVKVVLLGALLSFAAARPRVPRQAEEEVLDDAAIYDDETEYPEGGETVLEGAAEGADAGIADENYTTDADGEAYEDVTEEGEGTEGGEEIGEEEYEETGAEVEAAASEGSETVDAASQQPASPSADLAPADDAPLTDAGAEEEGEAYYNEEEEVAEGTDGVAGAEVVDDAELSEGAGQEPTESDATQSEVVSPESGYEYETETAGTGETEYDNNYAETTEEGTEADFQEPTEASEEGEYYDEEEEVVDGAKDEEVVEDAEEESAAEDTEEEIVDEEAVESAEEESEGEVTENAPVPSPAAEEGPVVHKSDEIDPETPPIEAENPDIASEIPDTDVESTDIVTETPASAAETDDLDAKTPTTDVDTPLIVTDAPVVVTDASVITTDAPVIVTDAPVITTDAPVIVTEEDEQPAVPVTHASTQVPDPEEPEVDAPETVLEASTETPTLPADAQQIPTIGGIVTDMLGSITNYITSTTVAPSITTEAPSTNDTATVAPSPGTGKTAADVEVEEESYFVEDEDKNYVDDILEKVQLDSELDAKGLDWSGLKEEEEVYDDEEEEESSDIVATKEEPLDPSTEAPVETSPAQTEAPSVPEVDKDDINEEDVFESTTTTTAEPAETLTTTTEKPDEEYEEVTMEEEDGNDELAPATAEETTQEPIVSTTVTPSTEGSNDTGIGLDGSAHNHHVGSKHHHSKHHHKSHHRKSHHHKKHDSDDSEYYPVCQLTAWSEWSGCSAVCGGGDKTRRRYVPYDCLRVPADAAFLEDIQACNLRPCPVDCAVSNWGAWCACSVTCGPGRTVRRRVVARPALFGGRGCPDLEQTQGCLQNRLVRLPLDGPLAQPFVQPLGLPNPAHRSLRKAACTDRSGKSIPCRHRRQAPRNCGTDRAGNAVPCPDGGIGRRPPVFTGLTACIKP